MSRNTDNDNDVIVDATRHATALAWARSLLPRGMEVALRRSGRRYIWPPQAWVYLSKADQDFFHEYGPELSEIVRRKLVPETDVKWSPPELTILDSQKHGGGVTGPASQLGGGQAPHPTTSTTTANCPYCGGDRPCVGPKHPYYRVFHFCSPEERERRHAESLAIQLRQP